MKNWVLENGTTHDWSSLFMKQIYDQPIWVTFLVGMACGMALNSAFAVDQNKQVVFSIVATIVGIGDFATTVWSTEQKKLKRIIPAPFPTNVPLAWPRTASILVATTALHIFNPVNKETADREMESKGNLFPSRLSFRQSTFSLCPKPK